MNSHACPTLSGTLFNVIVNKESPHALDHVVVTNGVQSGDWLLQRKRHSRLRDRPSYGRHPAADEPLSGGAHQLLLEDESTMTKIWAGVLYAESMLDPEARADAFQASDLDTIEHVRAAEAVLARPYPAEVTRDRAEQRVLALHVLSLSRHTTVDGCFAALDAAFGFLGGIPPGPDGAALGRVGACENLRRERP